jgi:hypothetical protein
MLLIAIIDQINTGINVLDPDLLKEWQIRTPKRGVGPGKVIDFARQEFLTREVSVRVRPDELHANSPGFRVSTLQKLNRLSRRGSDSRVPFHQGNGGFSRGEEETAALASCDKLGVLTRRGLNIFESQGQMSQARQSRSGRELPD